MFSNTCWANFLTALSPCSNHLNEVFWDYFPHPQPPTTMALFPLLCSTYLLSPPNLLYNAYVYFSQLASKFHKGGIFLYCFKGKVFYFTKLMFAFFCFNLQTLTFSVKNGIIPLINKTLYFSWNFQNSFSFVASTLTTIGE